MKVKFILLLMACFFLCGCSAKNIDVNPVYDKLASTSYEIERCIKQEDYEYKITFDVEFLDSKKVNVKLNDYTCVSSKCYTDEMDEIFLIALLFMSESKSETFDYEIIAENDLLRIKFIDKNGMSYFKVDDFTFKYNGDIYDVNNVNNMCIKSNDLFEENSSENNNSDGGVSVTDSVYAKNCAIDAVRQKLKTFTVKDVDVTTIIMNDTGDQTTFTVNGSVEYINIYNAKVTMNFVCQISNLSTCSTSVSIY